jgi:hypothetical protein
MTLDPLRSQQARNAQAQARALLAYLLICLLGLVAIWLMEAVWH